MCVVVNVCWLVVCCRLHPLFVVVLWVIHNGRREKEINLILIFGSVVNFVDMVSFKCGEFLQNVVNFSGVVNKIQIHQSTVIRNGTVLP